MAQIALILPNLVIGGTERVAVTLAHEFVARGHQVSVILLEKHGELLAELPTSVVVHDLAASRIRRAFPRLIRHFRHHHYDLAIANLWPLTVAAPLAARIAGSETRVAVVEHCPLSAQYRDWGGLHRLVLRSSIRLAFPLAAARVGVSSAVTNDLAKLSGLPRDDFTVISNPIRICAVSSRERAAAKAYWLPGMRRVLSVGRLKPEKNQALLIRAVARLQTDGPVQLMLLGEGPCQAHLRAVAHDEGVTDRVSFTGFQSNPFAFYETADVFALASDYEGFGNVLVEALACGMPVVSTDCLGGPREILDHGRWGRLTPPGDLEAMTVALAEALATPPPDRAALRDRAEDFAPAAVAQRYIALAG